MPTNRAWRPGQGCDVRAEVWEGRLTGAVTGADTRTRPYRGPDRRAAPTVHPVGDAAVVTAAALLVVLGVLFSMLASRDARPDDLDLRHLNGLLAAVCAVFAISAGYISALRWRVVGDTSSLRAGVALFVLGMSFVFTDLVPLPLLFAFTPLLPFDAVSTLPRCGSRNSC